LFEIEEDGGGDGWINRNVHKILFHEMMKRLLDFGRKKRKRIRRLERKVGKE